MATRRHVIATAASVLVTVVLAAVAHAALHVMPPPAGNDANSGLDWSHPKATISGAMAAASAGTEIWVAAGTYQEHVQMKSGVALYGGFSGSETARDQRNWTTNITTPFQQGAHLPILATPQPALPWPTKPSRCVIG